ncbi:MAG TPA: glycosyltransferase [Gammaproteobacteria bacterium]|jgi:GT2 family glycosyltransferase|nr:glycosyltransferase [Gammaproteobacteria bacterium]
MTAIQPTVSILIPHYKTRELTKLCLSLLRQYTDLNQARIIVIDNDSQDDSSDYLRSLTGIQLIERTAVPGESPVQAHARALDLALASVETPFVLSIHTDTLVKHPKWLPFLLSYIEHNTNIAGVGSWKLESKPWWRRCLKSIEHYIQLGMYRLIGRTQHGLAGVGKNYYYLRSHCALYRTDLLRQHGLYFGSGDMVAGKDMHQKLVALGYQMLFLSSDVLIQYVEHINHATTVLNPSLSTRQKSVAKGLQRIQKAFSNARLS